MKRRVGNRNSLCANTLNTNTGLMTGDYKCIEEVVMQFGVGADERLITDIVFGIIE